MLRGVDLRLEPGERVALMGRNGAGKSTLLRQLKGLAEPTRGRIERAGEVALLLQNPGDYLIHEHAVDEAGPGALAAAGLGGREEANPRDLSGGERQRLALEVALAGGPRAAVLLDEPTRGMDRGRKLALARRVEALAADGAAVVVATHDTEFAAEFATRVVLMGKGTVIADGPPAELLAGGWHFSTEVARALDGAAGALTPDDGLRRPRAGAGEMSWQAGSVALLALVLLAGFGWYERRRPPAKVLALVAALAALAVIGRIAFAAIPNVKPSTDIVLFAGYALGAVPGFVVGAVFALVSNFFLGQGPWTVWQMAGWGGVAVGGAALAKAMRRSEEPGRLRLALACGAAGLAFGAWMDVYQWTLAARQDLDTYVAVSGTSLPYNLAHAIGNVVFCLLIGPAFVRALTRYRRRFEVRWPAAVRPAAAATLALVALLAVPAAAVAASPASRAARYLERAQNRTAASARRPASRRTSSTPAGRRWGSRARAAIPATCAAARAVRSSPT